MNAGVVSFVNFGSRLVQKKTAGLALGFVPTPTTATNAGLVQAAVHTVVAGGLAVLGMWILPRHAEVIVGAVGGEALEQWALLTPAAPYLSAYVRRPVNTAGAAARGLSGAKKVAGYVQAAPRTEAYVARRGPSMSTPAATH